MGQAVTGQVAAGHALAGPAGGAAARPAGGAMRTHVPIGLVVCVLFGLFVAMAFTGPGAVERLLFPAVSVGIGFWLLHKGRREDYLAFTFWLFMLTPFLRRLVDLHAGYVQVNLLMLAPVAVGGLCAGPVIQGLRSRPYAYSALFALVFACIAYGLVLAMLYGRFAAGAFDAIRWAVPPFLGLLVALDPERRAGYQATLIRTMTLGMSVMGTYGIFQYVMAPAWDTYWMKESALVSIGLPEPYMIRVFSTMNSPATVAGFLAVGLLWVVPASGSARLPAIGIGLITLLLTLLRTFWLGLILDFLFLVVFGASARARLSILVGVVCIPLVLLGVAQIPQGAEIINTRLDSMSNVQNDGSFIDRANEYSDFFYRDLPDAPFGIGLGANGAYQSYGDARATRVVDGAIMEVGLALGVFGGGLYFLTILATCAIVVWNSIRSRDTFLSSCAGVVFSLTLLLVSGTTTAGEVGVLFWLSAGFCLMARPAPSPLLASRR